MLQKPFLQGSPLIGVPICSNHWFHHHHLQAVCFLFPLQVEEGGGGKGGVCIANMNAESGCPFTKSLNTFLPLGSGMLSPE